MRIVVKQPLTTVFLNKVTSPDWSGCHAKKWTEIVRAAGEASAIRGWKNNLTKFNGLEPDGTLVTYAQYRYFWTPRWQTRNPQETYQEFVEYDKGGNPGLKGIEGIHPYYCHTLPIVKKMIEAAYKWSDLSQEEAIRKVNEAWRTWQHNTALLYAYQQELGRATLRNPAVHDPMYHKLGLKLD